MRRYLVMAGRIAHDRKAHCGRGCRASCCERGGQGFVL